jgi:hypothetical protein
MARPAKIPRNLHGALRELDLEGRTSTQIVEWLLDNYQICVTDETVLRVLRRVRVVPPVDGEGLTDLLAVRSSLRADLLARDWRQKHSAARLLVEIHQIVASERREAEAKLAEIDEAQAHTKTYTVDASPDTWPDPPADPEAQETQPEPAGGAQ